MVSEKHTNFLINTGNATAADIEGLGEDVRRRVHDRFGITLEWEIRRIGLPSVGAEPVVMSEPVGQRGADEAERGEGETAAQRRGVAAICRAASGAARCGCCSAVAVAGAMARILASRMPAGQAALAQATDRFIAATGALGLVVNDIEVEGRETTDIGTIMAALRAARGTPILAVNPSRAKEQLETLPWVRSAAIERRLPGTLFVRLVERRPLAVWQHDGKQQLIDREGEVIPVDRSEPLRPFADRRRRRRRALCRRA